MRDVCLQIRTISAEIGEYVAVFLDLQGPSIRTGDVESPLVVISDNANKGEVVDSVVLIHA